MTKKDRLLWVARLAEDRQARALETLTKWRKEANRRVRLKLPLAEVLDARRQRDAAATRWARARENARKARSACWAAGAR